MQVASFNNTPDAKTLYQCNVCGLFRSWSESHRHIERPVGHWYFGYEVYFITCSNECRNKQREVFIEWLSKYDGWTRKAAESNFDQYIKA